MTNQLGSYSACSSVSLPPLVITKINYNPSTSSAFPVSNDQEFIEITNTSSSTVNLSGIYFKELGTSYQFPYNSTISANSSLYLAANSTVFQTQNGFSPFGQYTRNLSNKTQKIVLADAFGNTIDTVEYFDSAPWPIAPDGNGSYLQLISTSLDNNLASSWVASTTALNNEVFNISNSIIYPNPTNQYVTISSPLTIYRIECFNIDGKIVKSIQVNSNEVQMDLSEFTSGIYFVKSYNEKGVQTNKLIKI
jgi:hypothetical protein